MTRRRRKADNPNHDRWLVSYADFITLLFAFFVVLYASSQADKSKMGKLAEAIEAGFQNLGVFDQVGRPGKTAGAAQDTDAIDLGRLAPSHRGSVEQRKDIRELRRALEAALAPEIRRNEVALHEGPDDLVVSLREVGFFDSGSARMKPDALSAFARVANILRDRQCELRVEGHTDDVPIHTARFVSNWELSTTRATEVVRLLIESYDFPAERLSAAGFAEYHPAAGNDSAEGRRMNRRIDVVILGNKTRPVVEGISTQRIEVPAIRADAETVTGPRRQQ